MQGSLGFRLVRTGPHWPLSNAAVKQPFAWGEASPTPLVPSQSLTARENTQHPGKAEWDTGMIESGSERSFMPGVANDGFPLFAKQATTAMSCP